MKLQLLRNASQVITIGGKTILTDPMLAPKYAYDPFPFTGTDTRNPTSDLPLNEAELAQLLTQIDAVLLTHLHLDHWDAKARELLDKAIPVFCQPGDEGAIRASGFKNIRVVDRDWQWDTLQIHRTGGRHGTGEIGERMGKVSGYVLADGNEKLYLAGDTIWCPEVITALDESKPDYIVLNGGGARFATGDPIVMNIADVLEVCGYAPNAKTYVVHLESVNHSRESRTAIRQIIAEKGLTDRCYIPDDGEVYLLT